MGQGATILLRKFLQKLQSKREQEAHTQTRTCPPPPVEGRLGYLLEKAEADCHLPFLLFWITKHLQLFPGLPWGPGEEG